MGTARIRAPRIEDAAAVFEMVQGSSVLDTNPPYAYLLLCSHFAQTGAIAEVERRVVGFVCGYIRPDAPERVFVWQVAVSKEMRGQGLGQRLLADVVTRSAGRGARFLEATVTPSNRPSLALFRGFARRHELPLREGRLFDRSLFPSEEHEPEDLLQIGPFQLERDGRIRAHI